MTKVYTGILLSTLLGLASLYAYATTLRHERHEGQTETDSGFKSVDLGKEDRVIFADRAPNDGDNGRLWVDYVAGTMYFRDPRDASWNAL